MKSSAAPAPATPMKAAAPETRPRPGAAAIPAASAPTPGGAPAMTAPTAPPPPIVAAPAWPIIPAIAISIVRIRKTAVVIGAIANAVTEAISRTITTISRAPLQQHQAQREQNIQSFHDEAHWRIKRATRREVYQPFSFCYGVSHCRCRSESARALPLAVSKGPRRAGISGTYARDHFRGKTRFGNALSQNENCRKFILKTVVDGLKNPFAPSLPRGEWGFQSPLMGAPEWRLAALHLSSQRPRQRPIG